IHHLGGECRFGFRAALTEWPDNAAAQAGAANVIQAMAGYEVDQGDARAARLWVRDLVQPDPGLEARIAALGQSPKTEYLWFDSTARDPEGVEVATMRMMLRFMKFSSSLYGEASPA
ncbi:MAG: hypothetical protein QF893_25560, partial [Alphaproteobacteria bacterium]|nr:hypothetical protein [Alphaproteobacteria bacterium]